MSEKKYIDGIFIDTPKDGAPDYAICSGAIQYDRFREWFVAWRKDNPDEKYIKFNITEQKNDKSRGSVSLYVPKQDSQAPEPAPTGGGDIDDDIPFAPYMKGEF